MAKGKKRSKRWYRNKNRSRPEDPGWRDLQPAIIARDGATCQRCGDRKKLHAHHVKPRGLFPELILDPDNCITMCALCHAWIHSRYNSERRWLDLGPCSPKQVQYYTQQGTYLLMLRSMGECKERCPACKGTRRSGKGWKTGRLPGRCAYCRGNGYKIKAEYMRADGAPIVKQESVAHV